MTKCDYLWRIFTSYLFAVHDKLLYGLLRGQRLIPFPYVTSAICANAAISVYADFCLRRFPTVHNNSFCFATNELKKPKFVGCKIRDMRSRLRFFISGMLVMTSRITEVELSIDLEQIAVHSRRLALLRTGNISTKGFLGLLN